MEVTISRILDVTRNVKDKVYLPREGFDTNVFFVFDKMMIKLKVDKGSRCFILKREWRFVL